MVRAVVLIVRGLECGKREAAAKLKMVSRQTLFVFFLYLSFFSSQRDIPNVERVFRENDKMKSEKKVAPSGMNGWCLLRTPQVRMLLLVPCHFCEVHCDTSSRGAVPVQYRPAAD